MIDINEKPLWLVWSNEHKAWWGPSSSGYRLKVEQAGRYTWAEALRCCESRTYSGEKMPPEVPVPSPELEAMLSAAIVGQRPLNLSWSEHERDAGKHTEWHAPCGCAYHPEPKPHIHPCSKHLEMSEMEWREKCWDAAEAAMSKWTGLTHHHRHQIATDVVEAFSGIREVKK